MASVLVAIRSSKDLRVPTNDRRSEPCVRPAPGRRHSGSCRSNTDIGVGPVPSMVVVSAHGEHKVRPNDRRAKAGGSGPRRVRGVLTIVAIAQIVLGIRVMVRLIRTAKGTTIQRVEESTTGERVSVIVPVLNEADRLRPCLDGLVAQGAVVTEILVVDGGSSDGTQEIVREYEARDERVNLIDASPVPDGWNGKVWGLHAGELASNPDNRWILTIDADVRPDRALATSLITHASRNQLRAMSVATRQVAGDAGEGLLHPSMLTTLVYRFGIPGGCYRSVHDVQANGQCMLLERELLENISGFASVRGEICEDVTLARKIVASGETVGFFETDDLATVRMYPDWWATWRDWPRSLPMRDQYSGERGWLGLTEVALVQALPLLLLLLSRRAPRWIRLTNLILACTRLGVLAGTRRAYLTAPWSYWLSPLADLPVTVRIMMSALRRQHVWRGRPIQRLDDDHTARLPLAATPVSARMTLDRQPEPSVSRRSTTPLPQVAYQPTASGDPPGEMFPDIKTTPTGGDE